MSESMCVHQLADARAANNLLRQKLDRALTRVRELEAENARLQTLNDRMAAGEEDAARLEGEPEALRYEVKRLQATPPRPVCTQCPVWLCKPGLDATEDRLRELEQAVQPDQVEAK